MSKIDTIDDIAQLITDFRLDINYVSQSDFSPTHAAYSCTLTYSQTSLPVTFHQPQSNPAPTAMDIIESVVRDAQSYNDYRSIDDFVSEFGYDTADMRISDILNIFNTCQEHFEWLCRNDGYPIYQPQLSELATMLDEYHDEIAEKVKVLEAEKQAFEAYNNPPVPEGFVSIKDVMQQFDLGEYGDQITDYNTQDLDDTFSMIADRNIDVYYSDLLKWLPENYGWLEDADREGLLDGTKGDLMKMIQMAQYVCCEQDLYEHKDDIISYAVAHELYSDGVYMVSEDIAEEITEIGSDFDDVQSALDELLDKIKTSLSETLDKLFDDDELAEKIAAEIIDDRFSKANPCIMNTAVARSVAEHGYEQAFQQDWENDLREQHIEKLEQIINNFSPDPYATSSTINFPVWEILPTEETFEKWFRNDYKDVLDTLHELELEDLKPEDRDYDEWDMLNASFKRLDALIEKPENQWNPFPQTDHPSEETNPSSVNPYTLLDRLKSDCDYYLGACLDNNVDMEAAQKHLWAGTIEGQIDKMRELYNHLDEKPEWLSSSTIDQYEKKMLYARDNDSTKNSISTIATTAKSSSRELNSKSDINPRTNEQEK